MQKTKFEVIVADSDHEDCVLEQEILGKIGASVKKFQTYDAQEVKRITKNADGILCDYAPINREVIANLEKTRVVVVYGVGYDNVDVDAATEKGIVVCNVPDYLTYEVSDHAMALILSLFRRVPWAERLTKSGGWTKHGAWAWKELMPISYLDGKTAGVVGFGRIGRQVAERLQAFKMTVMAFDPYVSKDVGEKLGVELVDLPTLMSKADIISVNALLTKETHHLIGPKQLQLMKPSAFIVNTGRGKIIDQKALTEVLRKRMIMGAGLDVLEKEPPDPDDPILTLDNVIITPHIAGISDKAVQNLRKLAIEEVARVLSGTRPRHPINPSVLEK